MKNLRFATRLLSGFCLVKREIIKNSQKNIEKYFSKLYENIKFRSGILMGLNGTQYWKSDPSCVKEQ
ncbi:hypothetical protein Sjap_023241 [Stephania japonica]|uniref:Uncharacterized protein n=1 Tax=Stephania japonica TaxID=461633 RepID=A0AAP0EBA9_9MAGN